MNGRRFADLVGLCSAIQFESPSSWLARAALSQGVTAPELAAHIGWFPTQDLDQMFAVMYVAGLPKDAPALAGLEVARRVMMGYQRSGCRADRMLLTGRKRRGPEPDGLLSTVRRRARYRFCPACLRTDWVPYIRQEWRFNCWRYCPEHSCLLEEACPHCSAALELPVSLVRGGPQKTGIADLSCCVGCGRSLAVMEPRTLPSLGRTKGAWELAHLENGRATVAAMYYGRVRIKGEPEDRPLRHLRMLEKLGLLPTRDRAPLAHTQTIREELRDENAQADDSF